MVAIDVAPDLPLRASDHLVPLRGRLGRRGAYDPHRGI